jgi:Kae1-associated kinase Bud32
VINNDTIRLSSCLGRFISHCLCTLSQRVFVGKLLGRDAVIIKERFRKLYRHPALDAKLTKERMTLESRCLVRARKAGVDCPEVLSVDVPNLRIVMEFVPGLSVKAFLLSLPSAASATSLARDIGLVIARLHNNNIVHGDLTTSNMLLRGHVAVEADATLSGQASTAPPSVTAGAGDSSTRGLDSVPGCEGGSSSASSDLKPFAVVRRALRSMQHSQLSHLPVNETPAPCNVVPH